MAFTMHKRRWALISGVGIFVLLAILSWLSNRSVASVAEEVREAWTLMEHVYDSRSEAIPAFLEALQTAGYEHAGTYQQVSRSLKNVEENRIGFDDLADATRVRAFQNAHRQLGAALWRLTQELDERTKMAIQTEYEALEMRLGSFFHRSDQVEALYNDAVHRHNLALRAVHARLLARLYGHRPFMPLGS